MLTESSTAEEKVRNQKQENSQKENRQYDKESTALQHNPLTPNLKEESSVSKINLKNSSQSSQCPHTGSQCAISQNDAALFERRR
jgi:hypothetical protein